MKKVFCPPPREMNQECLRFILLIVFAHNYEKVKKKQFQKVVKHRKLIENVSQIQTNDVR